MTSSSKILVHLVLVSGSDNVPAFHIYRMEANNETRNSSYKGKKMRSFIVEQLASRIVDEVLNETYTRIDPPPGGVHTPASRGEIAGGVTSLSTNAQIGDSPDDWSREFGAMQAALDRLRRAGVSEAELRNYFRRLYGDGSDGYSAASLAGLLGTDSPRGRVPREVLELLGMDPELVNQTRRAVRRNTTDRRAYVNETIREMTTDGDTDIRDAIPHDYPRPPKPIRQKPLGPVPMPMPGRWPASKPQPDPMPLPTEFGGEEFGGEGPSRPPWETLPLPSPLPLPLPRFSPDDLRRPGPPRY